MMKWLIIYLVMMAFWLATCLSITKPTTEPASLAPSEDTRDNGVDKIDLVSFMNDCNETFRTEMSYIDSLNRSGSFPDETDKTAKCFVRCILEKSSVISEEGVVDPERALIFFAVERVGEDDIRDSTTACSNRNETCMCDRSYQFVKCVVETELNKHYILKTIY